MEPLGRGGRKQTMFAAAAVMAFILLLFVVFGLYLEVQREGERADQAIAREAELIKRLEGLESEKGHG